MTSPMIDRSPSSSRTRLLIAGLALAAGSTGAHAQQAPVAGATATSVREPAAWVGAGPGGATLRCRDGSYPAPRAADSACESKGGVMVRFPLKPVPGPSTPTPPAPAARAATPVPSGSATTSSRSPAPAVRPARPEPVTVPSDATLLCTDGTIIRADTVAARCGEHGGLRARFPRRAP